MSSWPLCAILIMFLHYGKETYICFASLKGLETRWAFSACCTKFLLTINQENQARILTYELCISSLV